ncbi:hypothetical protein OH77DRAFT_1392126 [Trametes cingulata]|nr:hypothetical protein OH77DRAFT_1392126 [Trametes cingulata]
MDVHFSVPFQLVSSTRYEPRFRDLAWNTDTNGAEPSPYLLLRYHYDRLLNAAKAHNWLIPAELSVIHLERLCDSAITNGGCRPEMLEGSCFRIRILLSPSGSISVTATPIAPLPVSDPAALSLWLPTSCPQSTAPPSDPLIVHLDTVPTPSSAFTRTKTTLRDHYNAARARFNIPPPPTPSHHEVLLFNENGHITETSIRNIAFARRSPPSWVTPAASSGCLPGVMRRFLLEHGRIVECAEGELTRDSIHDGEYVLVFNGVEGCRVGQIKHGQ